METAQAHRDAVAYDGFVSYSHAADDLLAPRLQAALQRFAKPWWRRRALRIFRDEASLSANPHLWSSITKALDTSSWFVLLLSPEAAGSPWVGREVEYWLDNKEADRILPVLTDGTFGWGENDISEGTDAAPPALYGAFTGEPRWVDMRWARTDTQLDLNNARFRSAVADIASAIRGIAKDELESEEVRQHRRTIRTAWTAGVALALLLMLATVAAVFAFVQRAEAESQRAAAEAAAQAEAAERDRADSQARIATVRALSSASLASLDLDPELSTLLALQAVEMSGADILPEAEDALHRAVLADRLLVTVPNGGNGIAHFAPDGRSFITLGDDPATVQMWSVDLPRRGITLGGHEAPVLDAVFSPDGARIARSSLDGTLRVWSTADGAQEMLLDVSPVPLIPAFSWDGSMLAATSGSGAVWVFDLDTGQVLQELSPPPGSETLNLDFSPDGSLLAAADEGIGRALVWDVSSGDLVAELEGHDWFVLDVGFTPDGRRLVTGSWDTTLKTWDTSTWLEVRTYFAPSSVWDLQVSADGMLVAATGNNFAAVWDLDTGRNLSSFVAHDGIVDGVDLSRDGSLLLTASMNHETTRVWDLSETAIHELIGLPGPHEVFGAVAFSPDGSILATSRGTDSITLWEFPSGRELVTVSGLGSMVDSMEFDATGALLATAGFSGVHLISVEGSLHSKLLDVPADDVAWSSSGMLAAASFEDSVRLWTDLGADSLSLTELGAFSVAFDPAGRILAAELEDGSVEVRSAETGELQGTIYPEGARRIDFSPDGAWFVTVSLDSHADLWDTTTLEHLQRLEGQVGQVFSVDVHPTLPEMATVGDDNTVRIWNTETAVTRLALPGPVMADVAYSPDGRYLAVIGPEGPVIVYVLDVEELAGLAQQRLTRWWTDEECRQYLQTAECPAPPQGSDF